MQRTCINEYANIAIFDTLELFNILVASNVKKSLCCEESFKCHDRRSGKNGTSSRFSISTIFFIQVINMDHYVLLHYHFPKIVHEYTLAAD